LWIDTQKSAYAIKVKVAYMDTLMDTLTVMTQRIKKMENLMNGYQEMVPLHQQWLTQLLIPMLRQILMLQILMLALLMQSMAETMLRLYVRSH
jgi:Ser/Thr protein kinase RdoA (MazF antagonist)